MTIAAGAEILAADILAIKADIDAVLSGSGALVSASQTVTSTSYTDMATVGPTVTVTTGTTALIGMYANLRNSNAAAQTHMSFEVSGATTIAADDATSIMLQSDSANQRARIGAVLFVAVLTPGSNTFTAKYKVTAGTGTLDDRRLFVIPLGV